MEEEEDGAREGPGYPTLGRAAWKGKSVWRVHVLLCSTVRGREGWCHHRASIGLGSACCLGGFLLDAWWLSDVVVALEEEEEEEVEEEEELGVLFLSWRRGARASWSWKDHLAFPRSCCVLELLYEGEEGMETN